MLSNQEKKNVPHQGETVEKAEISQKIEGSSPPSHKGAGNASRKEGTTFRIRKTSLILLKEREEKGWRSEVGGKHLQREGR